MAKKAKPKKDAENLRVHNDVVIKLRKAHPLAARTIIPRFHLLSKKASGFAEG